MVRQSPRPPFEESAMPKRPWSVERELGEVCLPQWRRLKGERIAARRAKTEQEKSWKGQKRLSGIPERATLSTYR
jgi:hypothetical protein